MGTSGSEGGPGKPTSCKADRAPRSDPYTYVSTWSGWFAYVAFVVDAYARRILGWRVASTMATSMVLDAIEQAIWTRQQEGVMDLKDVVHHTDRGSQYTSIRFTERLAKA
jgi:putative transposase